MKRDDPLIKTGLIDPRTLIFLLFVLPVVLSTGISPKITVLNVVAVAVPAILALLYKGYVLAFVYAGLYSAVYITVRELTPVVPSLFRTLIFTCGGTVLIVLPACMMAYFIIKNTKVAEINAAMEKLHITQKISIPFMVIVRFIPTLRREATGINAAMKMRGIRLGGGKPLKMLEYRMIPLLMSSVKIGDELSMAAVTRGLGAPIKRTPVYRIKFNILDYIFIGTGAFCITLLLSSPNIYVILCV